jgi:sec-independent protein translocase protein TatA
MVFGAKRLPEMGKSMGQGLRGFKDSLQGNEPAEGLTPAPMLTAAVPAPAPDATPVVTPVVATPVVATPVVATPVAASVATPVAAQSTPPAA